MEYKNIGGIVSDVDTASRRVKVVISSMGNLDHDNDVIHEKAYDKTIAERGPKGKNMIYFLRDHNASISTGLIGKFDELYTEGKQLIGVATLPGTQIGNDMLTHYQAGNIGQHSVGFKTVESENVKGDNKGSGYRLIKSIMMFEGSAVLFASNELTPTLSVGKSKEKVSAESICERMNFIYKEIKTGRYSEDGFELLGLMFMQLNDQVKSMEVQTTPAAKAPVPEINQELMKCFTRLNDSFTAKSTPAATKRTLDALEGRRRHGRA